MKKYFFLNADIGKTLTGIESSAFLRAKLFKRYLNILPVIVTYKYNSELRINQEHYIKAGILDADIPIINLFDFYCDTVEVALKNNNQLTTIQPNTHKKLDKDGMSYRLFEGKNRLMYVMHHKSSGLIHFINYMNGSGKIFKRDYYDEKGYLSKSSAINSETGETQQEYYFDREGKQRINIYYHLGDGKTTVDKVLIFNKYGMTTKFFNSTEELVSDFIKSLVEQYEHDEMNFIIDRCKIYYPVLRALEQQSNIHMIPVIHSRHINSDDIIRSNLNQNFKEVLINIHDSKATPIVLTQRQREDIEARFGQSNKLTVIPHAVENENDLMTFKSRNRYLLTALMRLSDEKQIDKMIDMFDIVHKEIPQVRLDIYGEGRLKNDLQKKIDALSLSEFIKLKGFVLDPYPILEKSGLSLLTSKCESFSLVVLESLTRGCPVISFDMNYGPSDMIKNGKNGYLVPINNLEEMAKKVIELVNNPELHEQLCSNAYIMAKRFSTEEVAKKWRLLLNRDDR